MVKRLLGLLAAFALLLSFGGGIDFALEMQADAAPEKVEFAVGSGKLQVQVYADDVIRVRFAPDGTFRDKGQATYVDSSVKWEAVDYTVEESDSLYTITTAKLTVKVEKSTGKVSYFDKDGNAVAAEHSRQSTAAAVSGYYKVTQTFEAADTEYLYGLGNVDTVVGNRGQTVNIAQANTEKRSPMFYSNQGYGILFDITSTGTLGWRAGNGEYYYTGNVADSMDYYFFYGPDADEVISGYRQVTGIATMLPKNTFGYVQSRNRYATEKDLVGTVEKFRTKGIPLDYIFIDYFWWKGTSSTFNNIMEWDTGAWPNATSMISKIHDQNVSVYISAWPSFGGNANNSLTYKTVSAKKGFLIPTNDTQFGDLYDPTSAENRAFFWDLVEEYVFNTGADSIWVDADEPEKGEWAKAGVTTSIGDSRVVGALYPLLHTQAVYEGQRAMEDNTKRVNTFSRGMVAGTQRYGTQSWSGDVQSTWAQLTKEVRGAMNYAAAGLPYFSSDVGGYWPIDAGNEEDREMFLRWLQFATFSSIMRVHGESAREPWCFGAEYEEYIVSYLNLRERLVPYTYSLAGAVTQDDYTILRPLVFDFRTDENVWTIDDQYMFGDFFMVCPVTDLGARTRSVYLPAGTWTDFWTGESIVSRGEEFTVSADLDQIPVFVKAGAVVPMAMESEYVDQYPDENEIRVYMGADGSFTLYEDEGDNYNYENGDFTEIELAYDEETKTLTIGDRAGSYEGMPETRDFHVVFVQEEYGNGVASSIKYDTTVTYTGKEVKVAYNPDFEIPVPPLKLSTLPKPGSAPKAQVPERALVGEWLFSEGEGAKVRDTSGYFNNGGVVNTNTGNWTTGHDGNAYNFSGGSATVDGSYVDVADANTLDMTTGISFSAWVNFTGGGHGNIVNKGGNGSNNPGYSLIILNGNTLQVEIQDQNGGKVSAQASGGFPKNSWHHVAFTWQSEAAGGDGIIRIYLDGVQKSLDSNANNKFTGPIGVNELPLRFGKSADNEPAWPNYFKGIIDEARLYNYALTATDIKALANDQAIGASNPDDIAIWVSDGALDISWTDSADETLASVAVTVESEDGSYKESFTVDAGEEWLTVEGLENGSYYYVSLKSVLADGSTSQGAYLVSGVNEYPAKIECVLTHDETVYGYITNYSGEALTGTIIAQVRDMENGSEVIHTVRMNDFTATALDSQRFQIDLGKYDANQVVTLTFMESGLLLAQPVAVLREQRYVNDDDAKLLRDALQALYDTTVDEDIFTEESVAAFNAAKADAQALLANEAASAEALTAAIEELRGTLVPVVDEVDLLRETLRALCAEEIDEELYTAESIEAFNALKTEALALCDDETATAEQLAEMILTLAFTLEPVEDEVALLREELRALCEEEIDEELYTAESIEAFNALKTEALALCDDETATAEQLTAMIEALYDTLEFKLDGLWGDVDGNGKVNTTDARLTLQFAAGRIDESKLDTSVADVDGNDKVNTTDARLILQRAAERIPAFPVEE